MVALFVVLTIIIFVVVDLFLQHKQKVGLSAQNLSAQLSLTKLSHLIPPGVFTQPTFTWSKILDSGNLIFGIHPVLIGIIGEPDKIELLHKGEFINKGDQFIRFHKGEKVLSIPSPLKGTVTSINSAVVKEATWENISQNWIYCIKPTNIADEIKKWYIAGCARVWLKEKFRQIRHFLIDASPQTELGKTMADGGDIPIGILDQFDQNTWQKFEQKFLNEKS